MALPQTVRVKLSSEVAEAISITPVVLQELPVRELVEHLLGIAGKDESRIREILLRGTLVSGASRFRWAGWDADVAKPPRAAGDFSRPRSRPALCRRRLHPRHAARRPPRHRDPARGRRAQIPVSAEDLLGPADGSGRRLRPGLFRLLLPRPRRPLPPRVHPRRNRTRSAPPPPPCATARSATRSGAWGSRKRSCT